METNTSINRRPSVLLILPQFPYDPSSGAARTAATICEMLAAEGFIVRSLATTLTESYKMAEVQQMLAEAGVDVSISNNINRQPVLHFVYRGVNHTLLHTYHNRMWRGSERSEFVELCEEELVRFRPNILFTYGGRPEDLYLRRQAHSLGCRVVFGLFNVSYSSRKLFDHVNYVLTPSKFLSDWYERELRVRSTPIQTPLHVEDVLAPDRQPRSITMVNPTFEKGVTVIARLAEELGKHFPDIPLEVVESRGSGRLLIQAGFAGGFDLRRHRNLFLRPVTRLPREIYRTTRVLLVPSVAEEASARVVAEALINGIPVIASDRGGLPENCGEGGFIIPLPSTLNIWTRRPVDTLDVQPWVDLIVSLYQDEQIYKRATDRARYAGKRYLPETVSSLYIDFFKGVLEDSTNAKPI